MDKRRIARGAILLGLLLVAVAVVGGSIVYARSRDAGSAQEVSEGGIVVAAVDPGGAAAAAGVVRGDILLKVDDGQIENTTAVLRYLADLEPGDQVDLTVLHGDDERTLTATLGERAGRPYLGLSFCGGLHSLQALSVWPANLGAVVVEVVPDSPAAEAGLQEGDRIVALDGQELDAEKDLADLIAAYEPGDTVTLQVERPGEQARELTVRLGEHPNDERAAYLGVRYMPLPHFEGEAMPEHFFGERFFDGAPFDREFEWPDVDVEQGAIILGVAEGSPAAEAGLSAGQVITAVDGEPVESPQGLTDAIAGREPGDRVALTVQGPDDEEAREVQVTLAEHPDKAGTAYLGVSVGGYYRGFFRGGGFEGRVPPEGLRPLRRFVDGLPFQRDGGVRPRGFQFRAQPRQFFDFQWDDGFEFDWDGDFEFSFPPGFFEDEPCCSGDNTL